MADATLEAALAHPTWRMGIKNTVDSASMMNKGSGGHRGQPPVRPCRPIACRFSCIPQSIAHGMVVFTDGSVKIQAAAPDMRLPIGYALAYPDRLVNGGRMPPDPLAAVGAHPEAAALRYDFERPDPERFPCVRLAYEALAAGGTMPAVLSAANEVAVAGVCRGRDPVRPRSRQSSKQRCPAPPPKNLSLDGVRRADRDARERARETVARLRASIEV